MCGFVCLWNAGDRDLARQMIARIGHRGPDAVAVVEVPNIPVIMAHCRLSIIGLEAGAQPMHQGDARLVANGEIYDHADLRAILGPAGFETASDSETILKLFARQQTPWVHRLDGMFAFVLATPERIVAARDPLGIKPLFRAQIGDGFAYASELKAFDGLGLSQIQAVAPGTLHDSRDGTRRWYRGCAGTATPEPDLDEAATWRELRAVLEDAVAKWMVADVEVGAFLSGGLDSSIIAAMAARIAPYRLKTFSVGMAGSPDLAAARRVARHIGSEHHERVFTVAEIAQVLPKVIYHLESADIDLVRSAVPTHFAATLARPHVKAVLTGEGADELFAGYRYHEAYVDHPRQLADELTRSLTTMHNINLQRVDRITMGLGLEARTPFLDRELIEFAQSIPVTLKLRRTPGEGHDRTGPVTEKWILRKACEDLLPADLIWRKKAQFDEGSGTVGALEQAAAPLQQAGTSWTRRAPDRAWTQDAPDRAWTQDAPDRAWTREAEGAVYERLLRAQYRDAQMILSQAGRWETGRVMAPG